MQARFVRQGFVALALMAAWVAPAQAEKFDVDPGHSSVLFRVLHIGTSNAWGRFGNVSGVVDLDEKDPAKSLFDITIATESVDTGLPKRDEHLRGPDFFNARQFPKITFKSQSVRATGPDTYEVKGTLTLHGVSKPLSVTLKKIGAGKSPFNDFRLGVETSFQIKRSDFDMKNMLEGVGDDVLLIVSLESMHK
jgi:polyisoprenoid-binding protein YceI